MTNTIIGLSIDAADAAALASFWAEALGREVAAGADQGHAVVTISGIELAEQIKKGQFKTGKLGGRKDGNDGGTMGCRSGCVARTH